MACHTNRSCVYSDDELFKCKHFFSGPQRLLRAARRTVDLRATATDIWSTVYDPEFSEYKNKLQGCYLLPSAMSLMSSRVYSSREHLPFVRHTYRRDMDRSRKKLCERSTKIGPVRVVATLFQTSTRIKGSIPKYPGQCNSDN